MYYMNNRTAVHVVLTIFCVNGQLYLKKNYKVIISKKYITYYIVIHVAHNVVWVDLTSYLLLLLIY